MKKTLHIIAFDVPYPPNYGGIVDVFYKLKTLSEVGTQIIYHCFYYEGHNPPNSILDQYCHEIHYYPRKKQLGKLMTSSLPYVVSSRNNPELLERLKQTDAPILFDGIQTCFFLNHPDLANRIRIFRANNIEHLYYDGLAKWETSWLKKQYLKLEARRLARFEKKIKGVDYLLSVAKMDIPHFSQYGNTLHVPPFFNNENDATQHQTKVQHQVLFQGNLSVKENEHAAIYILEKVAPLSSRQFVIAGKSPSARLKNLTENTKNATLFDTPSLEKMDELIRESAINLLLTFQQTGIKLKLLHALESGQHIIINSYMDDAGIFKSMCHVADEPSEITAKIEELIETPFTKEARIARHAKFDQYYNNVKNAEQILACIP